MATNRIPRDELIEDVEEVAAEVGRPPTVREYKARGRYSYSAVANRFGEGSWLDALETLGYEPSPWRELRIDRERLIEDVEQVIDAVGQPLTKQEYSKIGSYNP